jgi:putative membrane protein
MLESASEWPGRLNNAEELMSIRPARSMAIMTACAVGVVWAACSKSVSKTDTVAAMDTTTRPAAATPTPDSTSMPVATLTDVNIVALLDEANAGDSAMGKLAAMKGTSAAVKDFGRQMERDHHTLREQGQALAKKENLAPQAPANDTLATGSSKMHDNLDAMPKGADWDKAYIDNEVAVHQSVLNLLQTAGSAAQDTSLKALIIKVQPLVQAHLTKAQAIQSKLTSTTATTMDTGMKPMAGKKKG